MFFAMNRFKVRTGAEQEFEAVWKNRDSRLNETPGFREFRLLRGAANEKEGYTLYVSHSIWENEDAFLAWTRSQNFRDSHRQAGDKKPLYLEPPVFEGFKVVEGA
ncbi:antibiotic biosynthesis monooxygenase [Aminobacter sp. J44]|uniref:antibiotic biosynthesis monooxygenase family protein n=1 Tax=Aminobacter sp. J44 TaxID=935262 RepID=UPI00119B038A|nr:antibiotic biosynthesis monooxygenase [Aminobacter sp. J44]TWG61430.1 heme-degrading monooxygenase HmoA [Aminobacter sp. J44]